MMGLVAPIVRAGLGLSFGCNGYELFAEELGPRKILLRRSYKYILQSGYLGETQRKKPLVRKKKFTCMPVIDTLNRSLIM